jgi:hypothetical protein
MADEPKPQTSPPPPSEPEWKGSLSSKDPLKAPDGHESLTKEDIKDRA